MDNISQLLFLVSDSLLIPDIIVLLVLFVRALFLVGSFYNQYITKYKNERQLRPILNELTPERMEALQAALPPALTGLSQGDISKMASNMQVVFATTVVGLVVSLVGLVTLQFKQRWYAKEVNQLDYITRIRNQQISQK